MTLNNGLPCKRCGTSNWYNNGTCKVCQRESSRQCSRNNPERKREWQRVNPDKVAEYGRRWAQANSDKIVERNRRWAQDNPEKHVARQHRRRTRKTEAGGSHTAAEFKALCSRYGNKCLRCGSEGVKLTFDHVLPVSKGGSSDISNGQPLCKSCNSAKGDRHIDYRPDAGAIRWIQAKLFG